MIFTKQAIMKQIYGFAFSGVLSTLIMYCLYVSLYHFVNYQHAYLIAYSISVVILYFMNIFVFKRRISLNTFLKFPLIYLMQYLIAAYSLSFLVRLGIPAIYAPLLVIVMLFPFTFLLNLLLFTKY